MTQIKGWHNRFYEKLRAGEFDNRLNMKKFINEELVIQRKEDLTKIREFAEGDRPMNGLYNEKTNSPFFPDEEVIFYKDLLTLLKQIENGTS